jgi:hypothetical protein
MNIAVTFRRGFIGSYPAKKNHLNQGDYIKDLQK